ncbi:MAG: Sensor protein fixL, partial [Planctomycetota bacterium]
GLIRTGINGTNLSELIGELALNSSEMSNVWCHWIPPASMPILNPTSATHLYRIVQESVTNALKHSQAKNIVITVMPGQVDGQFELRVEDDGKGMVSDSKQMGMGLLIMQYRANVLGAKLRLESSEELGTTVICEFRESTGT